MMLHGSLFINLITRASEKGMQTYKHMYPQAMSLIANLGLGWPLDDDINSSVLIMDK